ncbi:MAG: lipoyl(octanoyl) transferase LipB [Candidatus Acidiferrales bacterium]
MSISEKTCWVVDLGLMAYQPAFDLQRRLVAARKCGAVPDVLLLCEHPHVITLGRNGRQEHLLASAQLLRQMGVEFHASDRGGDITYHGPGQIVGYPILNLAAIRRDVAWYVRQLEEAMIRATAEFGIVAGRKAGMTGVWVDDVASVTDIPGQASGVETPEAPVRYVRTEALTPYQGPEQSTSVPSLKFAAIFDGFRDTKHRDAKGAEAAELPAGYEALTSYQESQGQCTNNAAKDVDSRDAGAEKLAAIGVHLSRWVTSHGFAYNVSTDLRYFDLIVPCGIADKRATSLERLLGRAVRREEVTPRIVAHLGDVFEREMQAVSGEMLEEALQEYETPRAHAIA